MKSSRSKYVALAFLTLFLFTFTFQNLAGITRNFKLDISTLFNGKYLKTVHTPADAGEALDENPFENETEDESETEVSPAEISVTYGQNILLADSGQQACLNHQEAETHSELHNPLYLVICTFRI